VGEDNFGELATIHTIICSICTKCSSTLFVATLALGSRPNQGFAKVWAKSELGSHISCSRECKSSHFGSWSLNGLLNLQRAILGVKNHWWKFFLYHWKAINEGYNFALDLTSIEGLHTMLWASKVARIPILGISRLPLWSPETKWHLGVGPMAKHR
jgi:hypothetical protein